MSDGDLCRAVDPQSGHLCAAYILSKVSCNRQKSARPRRRSAYHLLDWLAQMLEPFLAFAAIKSRRELGQTNERELEIRASVE
jgi:hypothetical protein